MTKFIIGITTFFLCLFFSCSGAEKNYDVTKYNIVIPNDATIIEKQAAKILQEKLNSYSKFDIKIIAESEANKSENYFYIGWTEIAEKNLGGSYKQDLGEDGLIIKSLEDGGILLTGGRPRGTLYAVLEFLEQSVGIRFWTPTETFIPEYKPITNLKLDYKFIPKFNYRNHFVYSSTISSDFAIKLRENGDDQKIPANYGGNEKILGYVHTFGKIIPPKKYFSQHPEWFSDPDNGDKPATSKSKMPGAQSTQLCLTNESLYQEFLKNTLELIEKNPGFDIIDVSQNDSSSYCKSDACLKVIKEEGSPSGLILRFVNRLAKDVNKVYPNKKIMTLAYTYSLNPPKITKPGRNVIVRIATMASNFAYPLNSPQNSQNRDYINRWATISNYNHYWGYNTNFKNLFLPHPSFGHVGEDLKFLSTKNVKGIFLQDNNYTNGVGYFTDMQTWVISKLMWNPNLDQSALVKEFMTAYYGNASTYLMQYLELMESSYKKSGKSLSAMNNDYSFITVDIMNQSINLFKQALNSVKGSKVFYDRVMKENTVFYMSYAHLYNRLKRESLVSGKDLGSPIGLNNNDELFSNLSRYGVKKADRYFTNDEIKNNLTRGNYSTKSINSSKIIIEPHDFKLYKEGNGSKIFKDPKASSGSAASISNKSSEWLVQALLNQYGSLIKNGKWKVSAYVRIENGSGLQTDGNVRMGLFNQVNKKSREIISIPINKVSGNRYLKIELNATNLQPDDYIWISINDKKGNSKDLLIDKFELDRVN